MAKAFSQATTFWMILSLIRSSVVRTFQTSQVFGASRRIKKYENYRALRRLALPTHNQRSWLALAASAEDQRMENIYQEWTISQDKILWENRKKPVSALASLLGRGLRGIEQRLAKLQDVESAAYRRLFVAALIGNKSINNDSDDVESKPKLVPASEVLRRIQWDDSLSSQDFSVLHYDRVEDTIVESPVDAPNASISGKATRLIDALPEHRIVAIKYKERIVWDRERREDHVFTNEGIVCVIQEYDDWKRKTDEEEEQNLQRQAQVTQKIRQILGFEHFAVLKELSNQLTSKAKSNPTLSFKLEAEKYVQSALDLFRQVRKNREITLTQQLIPMSDLEALDVLSEIVAILPDSTIRQVILLEISTCVKQAEGKKIELTSTNKDLPQFYENDLTETFIRGTGPGGQKINKTSNRVLLIHEPTQVRVECQDTRSLQQNRKIARKRLREKLDEYFNGKQSKANLAAQKASVKKAKVKARSRARQRQKQSTKQSDGEAEDLLSSDDFKTP